MNEAEANENILLDSEEIRNVTLLQCKKKSKS